MRVDGKVWVVTGAASGIGRELVVAILRAGGRAAAVDVSPAGLAGLDPSERMSTHLVDITDKPSVEALVDEVIAAHGQVDGLVNNAGIIQPFVPFAELAYRDIDRVLDVNLMGTVHMLKAFLPVLLQRPQAQIVNLSSMGGFFPFPDQTVYGASKAAVKLLTEGLYAELLDTQVSVSLVMPGPVATSIADNSHVAAAGADRDGVAAKMMMSASDAAAVMLAGIERDRLHIYVGWMARVSSIAIRVAPKRSIALVRKQMQKMTAGATKADAAHAQG